MRVAIAQDPTNRSVQFVVQQAGRIRVVESGTVLGTDFLDLTPEVASDGERGFSGWHSRRTTTRSTQWTAATR